MNVSDRRQCGYIELQRKSRDMYHRDGSGSQWTLEVYLVWAQESERHVHADHMLPSTITGGDEKVEKQRPAKH